MIVFYEKAVRVALKAVYCREFNWAEEDGTYGDVDDASVLFFDNLTPCNGDGTHKFLLLVTFFCLTWCIGACSLAFSGEYLFSTRPAITQAPHINVCWTLTRLLAVGAKQLVSPDEALGIGFALALAMCLVEWNHATTTGPAFLNACQFSALVACLLFFPCVLLTAALPSSWVPLSVYLTTLGPAMWFAYKLRLRAAQARGEDVDLLERASTILAFDWEKEPETGCCEVQTACKALVTTSRAPETHESKTEDSVQAGHGSSAVAHF